MGYSSGCSIVCLERGEGKEEEIGKEESVWEMGGWRGGCESSSSQKG